MRTTKLVFVAAITVAFLWNVVGCTKTDSPAAKLRAAGSRPNILLIVADDLGYTDLGVFGSEIRTPNIDKLAATGMILTNYYTAPLCAPTRAMLLSGTDHHRAGEGLMGMHVEGAPGYEGYLNHRVVSLATRLIAAGSHTYMAGKWHLGDEENQGPAARGFERSFALLGGAADHFDIEAGLIPGVKTKYRDDGKLVESLPEDFYSTTYYTDRMLGYLKERGADGKPFFAYLAYTAPHWPIQAPDEDIARLRGRYDEGYEILRQRRFESWKALGFAPKDAKLPNLPPDYKPWNSLSSEEKARSARTMEVYAAMIERMDREIGRVLQYLEDSGQLENTVVVFQSDNGAEAAQGFGGSIGPGWAEAASAPYYLTKYYASEGGIHAPAIVSAPSLGVPVGRDDSLIIAADVAPTFLELAGADLSAYSDRPDVLPITGRSFAGVLRGDNRNKRGPNDVLGWEHSGNAAIRKGDWKLLWVGQSWVGRSPRLMGGEGAGPGEEGTGFGAAGSPRPPGADPLPNAGNAPGAGRGPGPGAANATPAGPMPGAAPIPRRQLEAGGTAGDPVGLGGPWKLFNVRDDPAELHDLSQQQPDVMAQMLAEWNRYVSENGVIVRTGADAN